MSGSHISTVHVGLIIMMLGKRCRIALQHVLAAIIELHHWVPGHILQALRDTSIQQVKHNRSCIEPCLRQLICSLDSLTVSGQGRFCTCHLQHLCSLPHWHLEWHVVLCLPLQAEMSGKSSGGDSSFSGLTPRPAARQIVEFHPLFGNLRDKSVPFPRTSGARFCGMGECEEQGNGKHKGEGWQK